MKKYFLILAVTMLTLSACGKKKVTQTVTPTPAPRTIELAEADRPNIALFPRNDGHELTLIISSITEQIQGMEYELTYTATDGNIQIEKGAGGVIENSDLQSGKVERKILLGTESCTNGCKYKYDTGVNGGNLSLVLTTKENQVATFETPFILKSNADIKKSGNQIAWPEENFSQKPSKNSPFYVVHRDYKSAEFVVNPAL